MFPHVGGYGWDKEAELASEYNDRDGSVNHFDNDSAVKSRNKLRIENCKLRIAEEESDDLRIPGSAAWNAHGRTKQLRITNYELRVQNTDTAKTGLGIGDWGLELFWILNSASSLVPSLNNS
jgi:hypothetical protein